MIPVVGIDPSLTACGIAAMDFSTMEILDWKCIRTKPDAKFKATEDLARRIMEIGRGVNEFILKHPSIVVIEGQVGSSFGKAGFDTIFLLGTAYGAALMASCGKSDPIVLHSATIKARVTGTREKTNKTAAWDAVRGRFTAFPPEPTNRPSKEAVHDAVITAIAGMPEIRRYAALMPSV